MAVSHMEFLIMPVRFTVKYVDFAGIICISTKTAKHTNYTKNT